MEGLSLYFPPLMLSVLFVPCNGTVVVINFCVQNGIIILTASDSDDDSWSSSEEENEPPKKTGSLQMLIPKGR